MLQDKIIFQNILVKNNLKKKSYIFLKYDFSLTKNKFLLNFLCYQILKKKTHQKKNS